ncbi:E3 ubiquitin-protein ligase RLIM-like isoform X1 [Ostrinia furnacalis]|uniref:E3 ubiquitin-protein ligase RLIM-like isoform X1 n=1 Tax=Ostrinia furnacalis TaxID=93504 RepID=UPI00103EF88D|nr:E3 ubiquitin-protein ligase RLIM-like isoform X1 [Ostrinia furnacalis]
MNVREEDRQKNSCPSRGLGLAAAAIGVGVGAALYYFFSKRPENPDGEGSTTSGWTCEQPHAFSSEQMSELTEHDDSYITISENSTSDTSVHDSNTDSEDSEEEWVPDSSNEESSEASTFGSSAASSEYSIDDSVTEFDAYTSQESVGNFESSQNSDIYDTTDYLRMPQLFSDSDTMDWDVTTSSIDVPVFEFPRSPVSGFNIIQAARNLMSKEEESLRQQALYEEAQIRMLREEAYRERSWSLEECSICFDIILKDQQVTTLPCTHHFHAACIAPWLQEQQTCPNCRKAAE